MAAMYLGQIDAAAVGSYFVKQYYQLIQRNPQIGYQFYNDASTVVRMDGASETIATSTMNIHAIISEMNFTSIEVKTVKSLPSLMGSVLVMVSGFMQMQDYNGRRQFVQTFLLAPQEKGFFILNDMLHLLEEETTLQPPATILGHNNYDDGSNLANHHMQDPVLGYTVGEEIQTRDYVSPVNVLEEELHDTEYVAHSEEINTVDQYSIPETQQISEDDDKLDEIDVEESIASYQTAVIMVQDPPAYAGEPLGERPKQTYASILRNAKGQPVNTVARAAPVTKTAPVASDAHLATRQQSYTATSVQPENSSLEAVEDIPAVEDDGEVKSVYVGNLSASVSASDLEYEFKNFGKILSNGVTVRSRKDSGGFYAFVEFEDAASVQNALQASPLFINGQKIYVEGRRPNSGISRIGGGRRGRGRGGYQSDRGRFGGRVGMGGVNDGDYSSNRPRGNGVLHRVPRQERGILGNHAMRNVQNPSED